MFNWLLVGQIVSRCCKTVVYQGFSQLDLKTVDSKPRHRTTKNKMAVVSQAGDKEDEIIQTLT